VHERLEEEDGGGVLRGWGQGGGVLQAGDEATACSGAGIEDGRRST
jgi:hypothetical protein